MATKPSLYVDVEGFGKLYHSKHDSLWGLCCLMEGVYRLSEDSKKLGIGRFFAYQTGDGFSLNPEIAMDDVSRLVGASIALMQYVLLRSRHFVKCTIAAGDMSDITGCYPKIISETKSSTGTIFPGDSLMTIFPVMGTGLINSVKLSAKLKGAVIGVSNEVFDFLNNGFIETGKPHVGVVQLNWFDVENEFVVKAREVLGISGADQEKLKECFYDAVEKNNCPEAWTEATKSTIGL